MLSVRFSWNKACGCFSDASKTIMTSDTESYFVLTFLFLAKKFQAKKFQCNNEKESQGRI